MRIKNRNRKKQDLNCGSSGLFYRRNTLRKAVPVFLIIAVLAGILVPGAGAISWDGSSADTGSGGRDADVNGYALRYYPGDNCIGYRFSCVDKNGNNRVSKVIDVFRDTYYGNIACTDEYKFTSKYNKKQLIDRQYGSFSTARTSVNCYKETSLGFATPPGAPDTMEAWQNIEKNLNAVLRALGIGSIGDLKSGDRILVEPVYDIMLQSVYHALTTTEAAVYGAAILGMDSDGGASKTAETWGFISVGPNRDYPNHLFTPDGQGLWPGASRLSGRATFRTIINCGYGVGIAYTDTSPEYEPGLDVRQASAFRKTEPAGSYCYGTSTAYSFSAYTCDKGYPASGDSITFTVYFPAETESVYVRQKVWIDGSLAGSRTCYTESGTSFDVSPQPGTVPEDKSSYRIEAEEDWIDTDGAVLKYGVKKAFYIPVKPTVYRTKVTAYNLKGEVQAWSGTEGSSGKVYCGQKIKTSYTYTGKDSWESLNDLTAVSGSISSSADARAENAAISASHPQTLMSTTGFVQVPAVSRMTFTLTSAWHADPGRTQAADVFYIPAARVDLELAKITIADGDGYSLDETALEAGTEVHVYYTLKNNSETEVQADAYGDDGNRINVDDTFFSIPANSSIVIDGGKITVPDRDTFTVRGSVYLYGAGKGNTKWESNGNNNVLTLECGTVCPLSLVPVEPNAPYREETTVISSFWLVNGGKRQYTANEKVSAEFTVRKANGEKITLVKKTGLVVPGKDHNLVWFRWDVPAGLDSENVSADAVLYVGNSRKYDVSAEYETVPYVIYSTPDTRYERKEPSGFSVQSVPGESAQTATWWEYVYSGGRFNKREYAVTAKGQTAVRPATGSTAKTAGGSYIMRSGYGISISGSASVSGAAGYPAASSAMYTQPQYAAALFPEFMYRAEENSCRTLMLSSGKWIFRENGEYGNVHFTPLYFPDGPYTVTAVYSDIWTPAGMITMTQRANTLTIDGAAYDDWYIRH